QEEDTPWFEDEERSRNARQAAKSIKDFFSVNQSNKNVRFVVASIPDVDNPGASIYLYEDGELVSKNFELPSKPLPFLISEVRHDSIQLKFQPAEYGKATISNYVVKFKIAGEENWKTVEYRMVGAGAGKDQWTEKRTGRKTEVYPLEGLKPQTPYRIRVSAVCDNGALGVPSKELEVSTSLKREDADNVAGEFHQESFLMDDRQLLMIALPLEKVPLGASTSCLMYQLGENNSEVPNKVILVMGATGCGKTTLIN
ncbi:hypothetical protein L345_18128, partial [Ophiophagus hannah]